MVSSIIGFNLINVTYYDLPYFTYVTYTVQASNITEALKKIEAYKIALNASKSTTGKRALNDYNND